MAWQEPKTDWVANPKSPMSEDFNRIESNIDFLKGDIETKKGAIVDALNTVGLASELTDTHAQLASRITGSNQGTKIITPSTANQTIAKGFHSGQGYVKGDANLVSANIRSGKSIFGVTGTLEPFFQTTIASKTRGSFGYDLVNGYLFYSGTNISGPFYNSPSNGQFRIGTDGGLQACPIDIAVVTNSPIDLTNVKGLLLRYYLNNATLSLIASTSKMDAVSVYDARSQTTTAGSNVMILDTKALSGNFYVRAHFTKGTTSEARIMFYCDELLLIV